MFFLSPLHDVSDPEPDDNVVDAAEYSPEKNYYHPVKNACWKYGER